MFGLDIAVAVGSMIFPPVFDLIRRKVLGKDDGSPEATLTSLALNKPDVMPDYVKALADLENARTASFSRDVIGTPAKWLVTTRAAIRPIGTIMALSALIISCLGQRPLEEPIRLTLEAIVGSWFGTRITVSSMPGGSATIRR